MYLAELQFKVIADTDFTRAEIAIRGYIEKLIFSGQVLGREFPTAWQQDVFSSRIVIPEEQALLHKHHSTPGLCALQQLATAGLAYPQLQLLGMDVMSQHTDPCEHADNYILYSRFNDTCSAVRCAEHFAPIPLYKLIPHGLDHEALIRWQLQFQALDEIQMQETRVLRKGAERSLQLLHSQLNRQGRKLASQLERDNNTRVYYALYSGSSTNCAHEPGKTCPGCGNNWRLPQPLHDLFDFKCDNCRLVSNIAWDCQSPS
ncbi:DUF2310 family Zn-ribbon-containing protein [Rheinheimera baltica]|uniref:DUF2310 family Zn-ribbon-containing protein n=1 Tax=Rheinheimera baltica TaxID=67576 RepID=UPI00273E3496|nr:DUF2310 family Zn-ribbon-containing protein [Rheinheimera baltica]MDP5150245.1 DUF2310 family Zn-ribbon-containing protein [Rheinheimera baltica]